MQFNLLFPFPFAFTIALCFKEPVPPPLVTSQLGLSHPACWQSRAFLNCFKLVPVSRALEETQQLEVEKALVLANQGSAMWRQEKANKYTRGQVVSEDLSQNVVAVCGVVLPRTSPRQTDQVL